MDGKGFLELIERLRLIRSDDATCEVKECAKSLSNDIWESVSAFANTEGGTIVLGLSERNGFEPVSGFLTDRVCNQFIAGMGDGGQIGRLTNPPRYAIDRIPYGREVLLAIEVEELEASHKPCYITARGLNGGSYRRVDDADVRLTANEIYLLQNADTLLASDRAVVVDASCKDLDRTICEQAIDCARRTNPRAVQGVDSFEERLVRLNFMKEDGSITKSGLIAAGKYPQQFYPRLCIDVAVHAGSAKASAGSLRFVDRVLCEGPVGTMIDDAVAAIRKNLRTRSVVSGLGRYDELEIPEGALREAVANAVVHREYDDRFLGESIAVDIFDDRVEVVNPGGLWGKSRNELADGRSTCRNATLMKLLNLVSASSVNAPMAEGDGTGVLFIQAECERRGLRPPVFAPSIGHFKVVFYRPASTALGIGSAEEADADFVLSLIARNGELSTREIQEMTGLTRRQVGTRIAALLDGNSIEPTAASTSRYRKYRLARH